MMSNDVKVRNVQSEVTQSAPPVTKPVHEVLAAIRTDSLTEPQVFLDETVAKHGGE